MVGEEKSKLTMPPYVVTNVQTSSWLSPDIMITKNRALTGPMRSATKPMIVRPAAADRLTMVTVKAESYRRIMIISQSESLKDGKRAYYLGNIGDLCSRKSWEVENRR